MLYLYACLYGDSGRWLQSGSAEVPRLWQAASRRPEKAAGTADLPLYGYKLVDGESMIAEDEAEVIRLIYDRYIHTNEGTSSVAKYLNDHGYVKKTDRTEGSQAFQITL